MVGVTPARTNPLSATQPFSPAAWRQTVLLALNYAKRQVTNSVDYGIISAVYKRGEIWNPKHCRHKNVNIMQKKWTTTATTISMRKHIFISNIYHTTIIILSAE
jgi:hypothetical protein